MAFGNSTIREDPYSFGLPSSSDGGRLLSAVPKPAPMAIPTPIHKPKLSVITPSVVPRATPRAIPNGKYFPCFMLQISV